MPVLTVLTQHSYNPVVPNFVGGKRLMALGDSVMRR
jgi:hypothetical protein